MFLQDNLVVSVVAHQGVKGLLEDIRITCWWVWWHLKDKCSRQLPCCSHSLGSACWQGLGKPLETWKTSLKSDCWLRYLNEAQNRITSSKGWRGVAEHLLKGATNHVASGWNCRFFLHFWESGVLLKLTFQFYPLRNVLVPPSAL